MRDAAWSSPLDMAGRGIYPREAHQAAGRAQSSSSSSSESSSSSSELSSSGDSEDEDNPYIARPLPSWLLQDLAAVSSAENADTHAESAAQARRCSGANRDTAHELTDTSNRSSHTEVSIEIASLEDDATDTSMWSLRSAASLEEFSETNSDATDAPASGDGLAAETLREAAIREMTEMRWSAIRQQVRPRAHIHALASVRALSRALKHEQSHAR